MREAKKIIDISVPLKSGMVGWPGDPRVSVSRSLISAGMHAGTHIDAPSHSIRGGKNIDKMPLEATVGPARVINIKDKESISAAELKKLKIRRGERVLFKTRNSSRCWTRRSFCENFVYISKDAARYLAGKNLRAVGIDYLSVGGFRKGGRETHEALLRAGIWIIEGLNLSGVRPGRYYLVSLPLKITGADGAPARAVLF